MLIPFTAYRRRHAIGVFISIAILNALLLLGLATKTAVTPAEYAFAIAAIIAGVSYASIRDVAGHLAYAGEALKFYRDEADFAALKRYASGWRRHVTVLAAPLPAAIALTTISTTLYTLCRLLWPQLPHLLLSGLFLVLVYPLALSRLVHFLAPVLVGWKEIESHRPSPTPADTPPLPCVLRRLATADMAVTALITAALALPVRHNPGFQAASGTGSAEFIVSALILVLIVLPLTLISAWRARQPACAGDLYRRDTDLSQQPPPIPPGSRRQRWLRYSLMLCALTPLTCLLLGTLPITVPVPLTLALLLLPIVPIFWTERTHTLTASFHDAAQLLTEFPPRNLNPERMLELAGAH